MIVPVIFGIIGLCACIATLVIGWPWRDAPAPEVITDEKDQNLWAYQQSPLGGSGSGSPRRS